MLRLLYLILPFMKYFIILFFIISQLNLSGQSGFKKTLVNDESNSALILALRDISESELLVLGVTIDDFGTPESSQGLFLIKMDTLGNVIADAIITEPNKDYRYFLEEYPSFINTYDGNFVFMCNKAGVNRFVKIDENLNVLINKEIPTITTSANYFKVSSIIEVNDGYLVNDYAKLDGYKSEVTLKKLDFYGNQLSDTIFSHDKAYGYGILTQSNHRNYLTRIHAEKVRDSVRNYSFYIDELDDDGNIHHIDSVNHTYFYKGISSIRSLIDVGDGLIVNRAYETYHDDGWDSYTSLQPVVQKLDYSYSKVIWEIPYGSKEDIHNIYNGFYAIKKTPDGNFLSSGNYLISDLRALHIIHMKYSPDGEIIWTRQDTISSSDDFDPHYLRSTIVLPSGSIYSVGNYQSPRNSGNKGFIMKIDKNGCIEEDCSGRLLFTHTEDTKLESEASIYPNPVRDVCNISTDLTDYHLELYNSFGGIIKRYRNVSSDYSLQTDDLASGIYYVRISKGKQFKILKMVKM